MFLFSALCGIEDENMESAEARIVAWLQETRKEAVTVSVKEEVTKPKMKPKSKTAKIHVHILIDKFPNTI